MHVQGTSAALRASDRQRILTYRTVYLLGNRPFFWLKKKLNVRLIEYPFDKNYWQKYTRNQIDNWK